MRGLGGKADLFAFHKLEVLVVHCTWFRNFRPSALPKQILPGVQAPEGPVPLQSSSVVQVIC